MVVTVHITDKDEKKPCSSGNANHASNQDLMKLNCLMDKLKSKKTLLIGDGSLSDIEELNNANVHKHVRKWATIQHMQDEISIYNLDLFGNIVLSVGRNDMLQKTDQELFEETYDPLLTHIKARNCKCTVYICKIDVEESNSNGINECIERLGTNWSKHDVLCIDNLTENVYGARNDNVEKNQMPSSLKTNENRESKSYILRHIDHSDIVCYHCRKKGHFITDCPVRQNFQCGREERDHSDRVCYHCRKTGHFIADCPIRHGFQFDKVENDLSEKKGHFIATRYGFPFDIAERDHSDRVCYHCRKMGHFIQDCPIRHAFQFDSGETRKRHVSLLYNSREPRKNHYFGEEFNFDGDSKYSSLLEKTSRQERRNTQRSLCYNRRQPGHNIADCPKQEKNQHFKEKSNSNNNNKYSCVGEKINRKERRNTQKCVCYNCRQPGHNIADCPKQEKNQHLSEAFKSDSNINNYSTVREKITCKERRNKERRLCYNCRQIGHKSADCPKLWTVVLPYTYWMANHVAILSGLHCLPKPVWTNI